MPFCPTARKHSAAPSAQAPLSSHDRAVGPLRFACLLPSVMALVLVGISPPARAALGYGHVNQRVGAIEVVRNPDFDVAADPASRTIHLVWRDQGVVRHALSADEGKTWKQPIVVVPTDAAGGVRLARDSAGRLHLAYGVRKEGSAHGNLDGRIFHTVFADGRWSRAIEALLPAPSEQKFQVCSARIAIDGRDNVHIIGWNLVSGENWQTDSRTAYARKPAGADRFEPTIEFSYGRDGEGGARHGDIVTDPAGDVHLFYACSSRKAPTLPHATTHLVRFKDGRWSPRVDLFRSVATDMGLRAAVDAQGVLHVVGEDSSKWSRHKNPNAPIDWTYYNNRDNPAELRPMHQIADDWEYGAELLLAPTGDIWIARGSWQKDGPHPFLGRYARFDAAARRWLEPETVSPPGHRNADRKYGQVPKFVWFEGKVRLFYAEQAPGEPFKFYQRTFN